MPPPRPPPGVRPVLSRPHRGRRSWLAVGSILTLSVSLLAGIAALPARAYAATAPVALGSSVTYATVAGAAGGIPLNAPIVAMTSLEQP